MHTEKCFRRSQTMNCRPLSSLDPYTQYSRRSSLPANTEPATCCTFPNLGTLSFFRAINRQHQRHATSEITLLLSSHIPKPPIPPPLAPPLCAASPCIFSLTFRLTSKNLLTHRSKHTLSPLLRSPSRYSGGMHFFEQEWESL